MNPDSRLHRFIGHLRLFLNHCPRCNSSSGECPVCEYTYTPDGRLSRLTQYPLSQATKALWWFLWVTESHVV